VRPLTDIEARRVLDSSSGRPAPHRLALRLLLDYRLTAHEICRLTVDQVDGTTLRVENKRGQTREVALRGPAAADLEEVRRSHPGGRLIVGRAGPLRPDALRGLLRTAAAAAGVEGDISIHRITRVANVRA
jgi:integrase